jgi:hypothetical protein
LTAFQRSFVAHSNRAGRFSAIAFAVGIRHASLCGHDSLPKELSHVAAKIRSDEWERAHNFLRKRRFIVRLLRESAGTGHFRVVFYTERFLEAGLIVYWVPRQSKRHDTLPENARLLGTFNSSFSMPLPPDAASGGGVLILYSLADHEVVEVSKPFIPQKP